VPLDVSSALRIASSSGRFAWRSGACWLGRLNGRGWLLRRLGMSERNDRSLSISQSERVDLSATRCALRWRSGWCRITAGHRLRHGDRLGWRASVYWSDWSDRSDGNDGNNWGSGWNGRGVAFSASRDVRARDRSRCKPGRVVSRTSRGCNGRAAWHKLRVGGDDCCWVDSR
jgi:hypothetical protein